MGLTPAKLFEMEYREYVWACEIHQKQRIYDLKKHRTILSYISGKDPREIMPLPGDYDHVPKQMTQDEINARIEKLGIKHLLDG